MISDFYDFYDSDPTALMQFLLKFNSLNAGLYQVATARRKAKKITRSKLCTVRNYPMWPAPYLVI